MLASQEQSYHHSISQQEVFLFFYLSLSTPKIGSDASVYLKIGDLEIRGIGSYETGFNENDDNNRYWPIPNVIGVSAMEAGR